MAASPGSGHQQNALRHYASVIRRRWIWVALGVVVGLAAGFASTLLIKEERDPTRYFKATNTLIVNGFDASSSGYSPNLQQAAYLIRHADVIDEVSNQLSVDARVVNNQLGAVARSDVLAIDVTAISTDPAQAVALADTGAQVLNAYIANDSAQNYTAAQQSLTDELDLLKVRRGELEQEVAQDPDNTAARAELETVNAQINAKTQELAELGDQAKVVGALSTLQTASPIEINGGAYAKRYNANVNARGGADGTAGSTSTEGNANSETNLSSGPPVSKPLRIAIGGVAGLVMGLITAFLVEAWDDRVRRRDRVEALTGMSVIAEVPKLSAAQRKTTDVAVTDSPRSNAAERYRSVKTAVLFALHEHYGGDALEPRPGEWSGRSTPVVMFGSPNPSEGKTTTVANVAAVFGASGMRTLVIDCDYHKPNIANYLAPLPDLDHPDNPSVTRLDGVWFLPAPRGGNSAASVEEIRRRIAKWRNHFDIVLLDTPPILSTNDATDLIPVADTVVLVVRAGQSRSGPVERVATVLARYRADVLGVVFNGVDAADMEAYYGYYYGYNDETRTRGTESAAGSVNGNGSGSGSPATTREDGEPTSTRR